MTLTLRRIRNVACGGAAAVALCAPPAFAQDPTPTPPPAQQQTVAPLPPEPEGFTLTPFLGAGFSGDLESAPVAFGVALGYGLDERFSIEGELGFAPNGTMGIPIEFDTSLWSLSANVLYHFHSERRRNYTPYITGGLGVLSSNPDFGDLFPDVDIDEAETSFAWNLGAGLKSRLSDRLDIRGDLRYINASGLAPDHLRIYGGLVIHGLGR